MILTQYSFDIKYFPEKANIIANYFSRTFQDAAYEEEKRCITALIIGSHIQEESESLIEKQINAMQKNESDFDMDIK